VATVAINQATNAGILAASILGASDEALRSRITAYKAAMAATVEDNAGRLEADGWRRYLGG
jgi:5-(carboxyamino)imidazole ribonucleotide mutase